MKNKYLIWIAGTIFLIILIAVGVFAFSFLRSGLFAKPEIIILQPAASKTINNSEGILFIVQGRSKNGINRIVFHENGILKVNKYPEMEGADELLAQIAWMPDRVGVYELSFITYDSRDTASDPAVISIGVISDGLSQVEVDKTEAAIANSMSSNGASANRSSQPSNDSNSEDASGINEGEGGGEGSEGDNLEFFQADDDVNIFRPINSDFPPEIVTFEKDLRRDGNGVHVSAQVTAQDDIGIDTIFILAYSDFEQGAPPIQVAHPCLGETHCSANASSLFGEGSYDLIAFALDTIGQESSIHDQRIEISADQPPAFIEEGPRLDIPADFLDNLFINVEGEIIHSNPRINAGLIEIIEQINEDDCPPDCPTSTFDDVYIEVGDQYYDGNTHLPQMTARLVIPPRMETEYENPWIFTQFTEDEPVQSAFNISFTQEMYENGRTFVETFEMRYCGRAGLLFFPILQTQRGDIRIPGTPTSFTPIACNMKTPELLQLKATQNCPNSDYCLIVTWKIPSDDLNRVPVDHIVLIEKKFDLNHILHEEEHIFSPDETTYIYSNVLRNRVYEYFLYSVSTEGLHSQQSKLNIRVPRPIDDPERITTDWSDSR